MGEFAAEIDKLAGEDLQPMQTRKPKAKAAGKPADKPAEVKPPDAPADKPKVGEPPAEGAPPAEPAHEPNTVPELRKSYQALKKKAQEEYEPKIQTLEARVKELETSNPAEVKTLQSRLEAAEKRRDELESEIRFTDYSKSTDFVEKYQKPYNQAWSKAMFEVTQLNRMQEDGTSTKMTQDDFLELANTGLGEIDAKAEAWFPGSAARSRVMRHVEKVRELADSQSEALERARTEGAERSKLSEVERKASTEKTVKMLDEAHGAISKKWPQMFAPAEGDTEGNALLDKGEAMYQRAFHPTPENAPKTAEEAIQLHALVRNKVRNHDRLALWLKTARAKIKELETELSQYEASSPNGGIGGGAPAGGGGIVDELQAGLAELDELNRKS
jgi:hypothetical protein